MLDTTQLTPLYQDAYAAYTDRASDESRSLQDYPAWLEHRLLACETELALARVALAEAYRFLQMFAWDGDGATRLETEATAWLERHARRSRVEMP